MRITNEARDEPRHEHRIELRNVGKLVGIRRLAGPEIEPRVFEERLAEPLEREREQRVDDTALRAANANAGLLDRVTLDELDEAAVFELAAAAAGARSVAAGRGGHRAKLTAR